MEVNDLSYCCLNSCRSTIAPCSVRLCHRRSRNTRSIRRRAATHPCKNREVRQFVLEIETHKCLVFRKIHAYVNVVKRDTCFILICTLKRESEVSVAVIVNLPIFRWTFVIYDIVRDNLTRFYYYIDRSRLGRQSRFGKEEAENWRGAEKEEKGKEKEERERQGWQVTLMLRW